MAETTGNGLLLRDPDGRYFLFTAELLEQAAIPAAQAETLITTGADDVTGMGVINHEEQVVDEIRRRAQGAAAAATNFQLWTGILTTRLHTGGVNF